MDSDAVKSSLFNMVFGKELLARNKANASTSVYDEVDFDELMDNAPFFVAKLALKTLSRVIRFRKGVATDRLVWFRDIGGKYDFTARTLELLMLKKGMMEEKKRDVEEEDYLEGQCKSFRTSAYPDSKSD